MSVTAILVSMATTVAKATPSFCCHVTMSTVRTVLSATTAEVTGSSALVLTGTQERSARERSTKIRVWACLVMGVATVPPLAVGWWHSATATGGGAVPLVEE